MKSLLDRSKCVYGVDETVGELGKRLSYGAW